MVWPVSQYTGGVVSMIIGLPDRFIYSYDDRNKAYVRNGCLYVIGTMDYDKMMRILTYVIKGYDRCVYCGKELDGHDTTLDHMYPRNWGGISIPENLAPSCSVCNSSKSNLTVAQYRKWRKLGEEKRKAFREACIAQNEEKMKSPSFILPKKWVKPFDISQILSNIDFDWLQEEGNVEMDAYYDRHGHYPRPIIVSGNDWVFKGMRILYHAKEHGITTVPAVVLQNVRRFKN